MSKALFEKLAKHHAAISDVYEELAAATAGGADADAGDDDEAALPAAKAAGTKGKPAAKTAPAKTAKTKPAPEPEPDLDDTGDDAADDAADDGPTEEDVVAAAQVLIKAGLKEKAVAVIKKHGGKRVADLDPDTYAAVIADFKKAGKAKPAADDLDDI